MPQVMQFLVPEKNYTKSMWNPLNFQEMQIFNQNLGILCVLGSNSKPWTSEVNKPRGLVSQGIVVQDLRLSYVFLNQALTDRNLGWRGFWNSEMWNFFKLQPVFIESMMHAICGPIWKYINLKKVFKCTYCKAIFIFFNFFYV